MSQPVDTLELALRLRRDAEETRMPEYAKLMRRAADDLEAFVRSDVPTCVHTERKAG
jgi:hypothetical protein